MTYRWDSDIVYPYGYINPIGNVPLHPSESQMKYFLSHPKVKVNYAQGKTKMATWFVSNCNTVLSSRNKLIELLQRHNIQVDVYGKCGNMTCPKKQDKSFESSDECREMAAQRYKFYFALENSLCRDYVTEKYAII
jgi:alpha-1,3-fucosyltransferase